MYIKREDAIRVIQYSNLDCMNKDERTSLIQNISSADVVEKREVREAYEKGYLHGSVSADVVEHKRGEWVTKLNNPLNAILKCSVCGRASVDKHNFCPNCGADMRERKGNE